ncbi:MAG TPA: HIT family protein [bacterium]|jgi:diadenosine tetraphosphate (Ap4A) HIT family hydrolase
MATEPAGAPFVLHPRLAQDTQPVARLALCRVLLMNDARVPWLILVPERAGLSELHGLPQHERALLMEEIATASRVLERLYRPDKLNVGALGNLVPQLHVHVIGRYRSDAAWPGPIWGSGPAIPYDAETLPAERARLQAAFAAP